MIDSFLKVLEALDRLATFEMAFGIEHFRCVFSLFVFFYLKYPRDCTFSMLLCFVRHTLLLLCLHACCSCSDSIIVLSSLTCSGTQWQYFVSADLLVELTKCLLSSKVTSAVIIWRRHQVQSTRIPKFPVGSKSRDRNMASTNIEYLTNIPHMDCPAK